MSKETFRHDRGTRVALVKSRWLNSMHLGAKMASVAYNLLAALHRDPAWRSLRSVARLAEHARPARGASWLAARRPQRGGKARLLRLTVRLSHPFRQPRSCAICGKQPAGQSRP